MNIWRIRLTLGGKNLFSECHNFYGDTGVIGILWNWYHQDQAGHLLVRKDRLIAEDRQFELCDAEDVEKSCSHFHSMSHGDLVWTHNSRHYSDRDGNVGDDSYWLCEVEKRCRSVTSEEWCNTDLRSVCDCKFFPVHHLLDKDDKKALRAAFARGNTVERVMENKDVVDITRRVWKETQKRHG